MKAALIGIGFGCAVFMIALCVAASIRWVQYRLAALASSTPTKDQQ